MIIFQYVNYLNLLTPPQIYIYIYIYFCSLLFWTFRIPLASVNEIHNFYVSCFQQIIPFSICNFKPIYPLLNSTGIIYSIPCKNCNCICIGQTGRKVQDNTNEHCRACKTQDLSSKLFQHSLNLNCAPDFSG